MEDWQVFKVKKAYLSYMKYI